MVGTVDELLLTFIPCGPNGPGGPGGPWINRERFHYHHTPQHSQICLTGVGVNSMSIQEDRDQARP